MKNAAPLFFLLFIMFLSLGTVASDNMPYVVVSIECTNSSGDTTLDFRWDMSRNSWAPQIFLNGNPETEGTSLIGKEDGDVYEKPDKFSISLRPSDDKIEFTKSAMILNQFVQLQCTQKEEWFANGCSELLVNNLKELRKKFKE